MAPAATTTTTLADLKAMKLYRVFCTCVELGEDRGYTILKKPSAFAAQHAASSPRAPGDPLVSYATFVSTFAAISQHPNGADVVTATPPTVSILQRDLMTLLLSKPKTHNNNNNNSTTTTSNATTPVKAEVASDDDDEKEEQKVNSSHKKSRTSSGTSSGGGSSSSSPKLMIVFHSADETLSIQHVIAYRSKALKKHADSLIIIAANRVFANIRRDVSELAAHIDDTTGRPFISIQLFEEDELVVNPIHHETVPKHTVLSSEALAAMLKEFGTTVPQLPRMLLKDPIAQYFGLRRGDVVKIDRNSESSGPYVMYRQVI